jgi:Cu/Ag efflux protein CusF
MQRAKKIGYVVALVFGASAMSGISAAQSPQPQDTPQQNNMPPQKDMPQKNDMPKDTSPPSDMPQKNDIPKDTDTSQPKDQSQAKAAGPTEVMAEKMSATATVTKINTAKRQLMLKDDQGKQFELDVPEKVSGFDQIKKGDKVSVDYYSSVALSLKKSGAGAGASSGMTSTEEKVPGPLPGGVVARTVHSTVEVMKVDKADNKITVKTASGDVDTIDVKDSAMQADLDKIKKGDKIKASYTEAVAISVTPAGKQPT